MTRIDFLKSFTCRLCACLGAGATLPTDSGASEVDPTGDWRLRFVRRRYAKLIEILASRMDEEALNETLCELGGYCATTDVRLPTYRGDFEGYREHLQQTASGDAVTYDRAQGVITVTSPERSDCFCPLASVHTPTPKTVCNCSLGWQQKTWETVLGKKVQVTLKESVLRGGQRCVFQIHVSNVKA